MVAKGSMLAVELVDPVHSGKNRPGDAFRVRLNDGVWSQGKVVLPPGTVLRGGVSDAVPSGRVSGRARLSLTLHSLDLEGKTYSICTDTLTYTGEPHAGKHLGSWMMGALQGAVYGVLFGGKEGAMIGAGAGAAAGTAGSVLKGKLDVDFPQGSKLLFETTEPLGVPEPPPPPVDKPAVGPKPAEPPPKPEAKPSG